MPRFNEWPDLRMAEGIHRKALVDLVRFAAGDDSDDARAVAECGCTESWDCPEHEEREWGTSRCRRAVHLGCPTATTYKLRRVSLPNLEGGAHYRSLYFVRPFPMGDSSHWRDVIRGQLRWWAEWVAKLARNRKRWKGKVYHRGIAFELDPRESVAQLRLMVREDEAGEGNEIVQELAAEGAVVLHDFVFEDGGIAVLQAMEDSTSSLLTMTPDGVDDAGRPTYDKWLFYEWWQAGKVVAKPPSDDKPGRKVGRKVVGLHYFQTYGVLRQALSEIPDEKPEEKTCDVDGCGKKLRRTVHWDERLGGLGVQPTPDRVHYRRRRREPPGNAPPLSAGASA